MMPIDYANYPKDWRAISKHIRFERAGGRCECRGECGITHMEPAASTDVLPDEDFPVGRCRRRHGVQIAHYDGDDSHASRVVLTVAHLCHDPSCFDLDHLRALCQRCHLRYDAKHHARNAGRTRRQKRIAGGQTAMLED